MYPVQSYKNPYSYSFPQSCPYYHYPSWNPMFPQTRMMDSPNPPTNYAYPQCSGFCNNGYVPGHFNFTPPCTHFQPPPQDFCYYRHVPYPPYPEGFSANVPPPYFPMQQQLQYERDKDQRQCCGCPNHLCNGGNLNAAKIEEENSERDYIERQPSKLIRAPQYVSRDGEGSNNSESRPSYWVPFDLSSLKGLEQEREQKKTSTQSAHPENQRDSNHSFWIPLDLNSLTGLNEEKENPRQTGKETRVPTSLPLIWFPSYSKPEASPAQGNTSSKESENPEEKTVVADLEGAEKESKVKTIPVIQVEENGGTKFSMPEGAKGNKEVKKFDIEKKEQDTAKPSVKKEASSAKASKLPPVCLRVDPLPKKKTANCNSRSSSPPSKKEKTHQETLSPNEKDKRKDKVIKFVDINEVKSNDKEKEIGGEKMGVMLESEMHVDKEKTHQENEVSQDDTDKPNDSEIKFVDVEGIKLDDKQNENGQRIGVEKNGAESHFDKEMSQQEVDNKVHENKEEKESKGDSSIRSEEVERKNNGRVLSEENAAVIIQSAFRGYEVRRWQPLEKLRKIARIRLQTGDIQKKISYAEASNQLVWKEKVAVGETIMNLLLQLDTIQGLLPSVRESRKSMAKELICLQEKLDLLGSQAKEGDEVKKVVENVDHQITPDSGTLETKQPKDIDGLPDEVKVKTSPETMEKVDVKPADSDSYVADQVESYNASVPSNEELSSQVYEEKIEKPSVAHVDLQNVPVTCTLENDNAKVSTEESKEVQELQGQGNAETNSKFEEHKEMAAESQDSGLIDESQLELHVAVPSNEEFKNSEEPFTDGAISNDGCSMVEAASEDQHESLLQGTEVISETDNDMEVPDLPVMELPELDEEASEHKLGSSEVSTGSQEEMNRKEEINYTNSDVSDDIEGFKDLKLVGENLNKCMKEQVYNRNDDSECVSACNLEVGDIEHGVVRTSTLDADSGEAAYKANTESPDELGPVMLDDPALAQNDSIDGQLEVPDAKDEAEDNAEEDTPAIVMQSEVQSYDVHGEQVMQSEVQSYDVYGEQEAAAADSTWIKSEEKKLLEENEKLREMLEKLLEAGKQHLQVIADLNGRVKHLERKLSQKAKTRAKRHRIAKSPVRKTVSSAA